MPGSAPSPVSPLVGPGTFSLGQVYPGGSLVIVGNTIANPTIVTTLCPHGLSTGDTVFWTASTASVPLLTVTPQQVVTVLSPTTFSIPVNVTGGPGTAGAYDISILSVPLTPPGSPAVFNCGSATGLRVGDTVTIVATGAVAAVGTIDGANTVTAVSTDGRSFTVGACTNVTTAGSATAGHFSKTTFNSDIWDNRYGRVQGLITFVGVVGTAPTTTKVDIQGSMDYNPFTAAASGTQGNWYNIAYAATSAPQTLAVAQLTIAGATTTNYKITGPGEPNYLPWRFIRVLFSTSTNILITTTLSVLPFTS